MNIKNKGLLVVGFIVLLVLFLYFGSGVMMLGGMSGRMNDNGWGWIPALFTFGLVVFVGWLLFRKKA